MMTVYPHDHLCIHHHHIGVYHYFSQFYILYSYYIYCRIMQLGITAYNIGVQIDGLVFSPYSWLGWVGGLGEPQLSCQKEHHILTGLIVGRVVLVCGGRLDSRLCRDVLVGTFAGEHPWVEPAWH